MGNYDDTFFDYVSDGAIRSARHFLPVVVDALNPSSVLDVGCGRGAWLSVWRELGVAVVRGIDGDYVDKSKLLCPGEFFRARDLSEPFDLAERFDLVQSLEVAEHLPESSARTFIASLTKHSDSVLFSAAPKGQGGDHHINEQDYDYWRRIFAEYDFVPVDFIRPVVKFNTEIEPWYRYNSILYVLRSRVDKLPEHIRKFLIKEERIDDISPLPYKLRKLLVSCLPVSVSTKLAKLKERSRVRKARTGKPV
jgi:SAM-dependent methyltransferase